MAAFKMLVRLGLATGLLVGCAQQQAASQADDVTVLPATSAKGNVETLAVVSGGPAKGKRDPNLQVVALFNGRAMPTGVTVSKSGRIFLCYPRWGDKVLYTAVELRDGKLVPFPNAEANTFDPAHADEYDPKTHLVGVQSVVVDAKDRLWLLDPGSVKLAPNLNGAPKLWGYDLATGARVKAIRFPADVALKSSYLNDVRFDLARGGEGTAYITDSGVGGIIIVDLASGTSWRRLDGHPSVLPMPDLKQTTEGQPLIQRKPSGEQASPDFRSDGIALSPDGKMLYYTVVAGRDVWAVPTDLLTKVTDPQKAAAAVKKIAVKPSGNDGIFCDARGQIYTTDVEDNAIRRVDPVSGSVSVLSQDERLIWPDTLAMHGSDLYVTSNQLARQPSYHFGKDQRKPPYALFRISVENSNGTTASR